MKPIKTALVCYTKWGYVCLQEWHESERKAKKAGRWMVDNDYAWSYKTIRMNSNNNEK